MCTHIEDVVYCSFHWMLHVINLCKNCVYVLDSLRSKVNEDIHGVINVGLKTWQAKHDLQRYRSTPKWRRVKCPRQLDSVGCGYYVQNSIPKVHIGNRRLARFEPNGQLLLADLCKFLNVLFGRGTGSPIVFGSTGGYIGRFGVVGLMVLDDLEYLL
uniref:Ubiquitin-like protease family profile domain-containing protein n=1 Tax=Cucumis melo TaxID=3656 RepID=A0A9I9E5T8_CUCME